MTDESTKTEGEVAGEIMRPSLAERSAALVESFEHAARHNAPVTPAMLKEMRDVLGVPVPDMG